MDGDKGKRKKLLTPKQVAKRIKRKSKVKYEVHVNPSLALALQNLKPK